MKGLLHNKRFKKNLKKWVYMYLGAIFLFTNVVTYSKYMTSAVVSDSSRVAKFDVRVAPVNQKDEYNPNEIIKYNFKVDYNLEVSTFLTLTITKDSTATTDAKDFTIEYIKENNDFIYNKNSEIPNNKVIVNSDIITIKKENSIGQEHYTYEVGVTYKYNTEEYYKKTIKQEDLVSIGYSAKQNS